ncbi:MAG: Lrp/AsnC family transcriptional regulator [Candidatus Odinarchaeia archaeon]
MLKKLPIVFIFVKTNPGRINNVLSEILKLKEVVEVHAVTGDYDIILKLEVERIEDASKVIIDKIHKLEGVEKTSTSIVLQTQE